jgi:hypothetical protein
MQAHLDGSAIYAVGNGMRIAHAHACDLDAVTVHHKLLRRHVQQVDMYAKSIEQGMHAHHFGHSKWEVFYHIEASAATFRVVTLLISDICAKTLTLQVLQIIDLMN